MRENVPPKKAEDAELHESEMEAMLRDPGVRKQLQDVMQKKVESWVHEKIPALGGRTPLEAVRDPDGKEMVEALLLHWGAPRRKRCFSESDTPRHWSGPPIVEPRAVRLLMLFEPLLFHFVDPQLKVTPVIGRHLQFASLVNHILEITETHDEFVALVVQQGRVLAWHGPSFLTPNTVGVFELGVTDNGDDRVVRLYQGRIVAIML